MSNGKPRIAKDFDKLSEEVVNRIKVQYPFGFEEHLISYRNAKGDKISALPYETEDTYYLIKMTRYEAIKIIEDDDDYDDDGNLRSDFADEIESNESDDDNGEDEDED